MCRHCFPPAVHRFFFLFLQLCIVFWPPLGTKIVFFIVYPTTSAAFIFFSLLLSFCMSVFFFLSVCVALNALPICNLVEMI